MRKGQKCSEIIKQNMRIDALGRIIPQKQREKMSETHKDKKLSSKHKKNIGKSLKGHIGWSKGKTYDELYGHTKSERIKRKIAKGWKNKKRPKFSDKWRKNIGLVQLGKQRNFSNEHKIKLREAHMRVIERQFNAGLPLSPNIGLYETKIIDILEQNFGYPISRQYKVNGYFIDGYCPILNLAIEVDESHHRRTIKRDIKRQQEIEQTLNCSFLRIGVDI